MKHCRYYNIHFIMHMGSGISYILCEFIWDKGMPALSEELVLFNACIGWLQRWIESCSMQTLGDWRVAHYWKTKESPNAGNAWLMSRSMQVLEKLKSCSMQALEDWGFAQCRHWKNWKVAKYRHRKNLRVAQCRH